MAGVTFRDLISATDIAAHPEIVEGRIDTDATCPECGSALFIDLEAQRFDPNRPHDVGERVAVAACTGCEFLLSLGRVSANWRIA